ncbi:MAG: protein-glutamate O-methyltransferase CheR [Nitrospirae bacterium]|nr:protein-glutamate O-methyltransferase CheR [Nitrospirota bacterium]
MVTPKLKEETFRQLRDFVHEKSGIYIPDTKKYLLENRLVRRLEEKKLKSYEDYLYVIKYSGNGDEITKLFDAVTTNETYFFREPRQFDVFVGHVVPSILSAGSRGIRVWSAACSTGEEPYTIAILFNEHQEMKLIRKEIIGSDISNGVLDAARKSIYSSYAVRNVPEKYLKKYFRNTGNVYSLDPRIKAMVKFLNINLVDEKQVKMLRNLDVVFCRNVLIYFDDKNKRKAVSLIYDSLKPKGYLFIGMSESLHTVTRAFRPISINKTVVYQKV